MAKLDAKVHSKLEALELAQKKRKKKMENGFDGAEDTMGDMEVGLQELEKEVEALGEAQDKKDLAKVGQRVCALEDAMAKLEAKVTTIEKPRCFLPGEVGTSKQKINAMADTLAKLEAKVASLEMDLAELAKEKKI
jgi:chromosome segregation ATPase